MVYLILYCITYYTTAGIAVVIGYHRLLSHRSLKMKKWFEYTIITLGLPAGTPVQWAGNHRYHHAHTEEDTDPHSPVISGFWYAHTGWYINSSNPVLCFLYAIAGPFRILIDSWHRPRTNQQFNYLAQDVAANSYYNFISKPVPYMIAMWVNLIIFFLPVYYFWNVGGLIALWFVLILIYNFGDAIDSISHLYGEQPYKKKDQARNGWFMAIVTLGDGWHADHHQFPGSARVGFKKGQFDISWWIIKLLTFLKIAYDVKVTSLDSIKRQLK
jgi:fatty-acid desaturase